MAQWLKKLVDFLLRLFHAPSESDIVQTPGNVPIPEAPIILPHYRKSNSLMTFQEQKFFRLVLIEELGSQYSIFSKVRLGDLIWIDNEPKDKRNFNNQLFCKHIDFVLCTRGNLEPVLALELDDSSHQQYDRQDSDDLKNRVCAAAGLPLLRVTVRQDYSAASIADEIRGMIRK